jgi:2,4-dichlorophenol 6-monooxygenase
VKQPDGRVLSYSAKYLVAADGGKLSSEKLEVRMHGPTGIQNFTSVYFKADLSDYWDGMSSAYCFVTLSLFFFLEGDKLF